MTPRIHVLRIGFAGLVLALAFLAQSAPARDLRPVVRTEAGVVVGEGSGGVKRYLGVPYAAAPVGPLRWRPAAPLASWTGEKEARQFGPACAQAVDPRGFGPWTAEYVVTGPVSEDCLSLNVWTPFSRSRRKMPVLVWVHGGGFAGGAGSVPVYDGTALARRGILVVTINYRLGPFGFLEAAKSDDGSGIVADAGLTDVVTALRWVRRNIARFGGDAGAVTVAGQSAGAMIVRALLTRSEARRLFQRAIVQSGLPIPDDGVPKLAMLMARAGAPTIAALRDLPADALLRAARGMRFRPTALADAGAGIDIPILAGMTADEASAFGDGAASGAAWPTNCGPPRAGLSMVPTKELARDCGRAALAAWAAGRPLSRAPLFLYMFDHVEPGPAAALWGAFHSSDIPYAFGTLAAASGRRFDAEDILLSKRMQAAWSDFVKGRSPLRFGAVLWPPAGLNAPVLVRLSTRPRIEPVLTGPMRERLAGRGPFALF